MITVTRFIVPRPSPKPNPVIYIPRLNGPLFAPKAGELYDTSDSF